MSTNPLFNRESYHALRKPLLQASSLPSACYTDPEFYRCEVDQVFKQHWQFVGRVEQLAGVGSYFCFDGPAGPVIILRSAADELKAFANSCRHRGARLLDGCGSCKRVVCPYHSWSYRLDGRLAGAPGMQGAIDFDVADFPLLELPLSCWAGFIFIHYQSEPTPLAEQLGNLCDRFSDHACADMRLVGELDFDIAANWKLLAENSLEAYHTGSVHRDTLGPQESCSIEGIRGSWTGLLVEDEHSVATLPGEGNPFPFIVGLGEEALSGACFTLLYPSTQFVFAQDCMWWLAFLPVSVRRTRLCIGACFPEETIAAEGFADRVQPYFERWQQATAEDNAICEQQQLGQAVARPPGRYADSEFAVHAFDNWVIDQVLDG